MSLRRSKTDAMRAKVLSSLANALADRDGLRSQSRLSRSAGAASTVATASVVVVAVTVAADGRVVRFRAALTLDEVNQLLSVLDEKPAPTQVTPPTDGSGSDTSSK